MTRTIWIIAALLAIGSAEAQVPRVVKILEQSYELDLRDVSFPGDALGSVNVSPCEGCARKLHSTTASTLYLLNGKALPYPDFLKVVEERRKANQPTFVGVYYDVESKRVNRILLKTR